MWDRLGPRRATPSQTSTLPDPGPEKERTHKHMSVARVTELSAISEQGFEDAIEQAIARATKTRKLLFHDVRE
jgi:hypothetical protein